MAKSKLSYKRTSTEKLQITGELSEDAERITYEDENGASRIAKVSQILSPFASQELTLSVALKEETDMDIDDIEGEVSENYVG